MGHFVPLSSCPKKKLFVQFLVSEFRMGTFVRLAMSLINRRNGVCISMHKAAKRTITTFGSVVVISASVMGFLSPTVARAHQETPGCAGNGSGGTIGVVNGQFHHVGDAVDFTVGVNVPAGQCQGSNIT